MPRDILRPVQIRAAEASDAAALREIVERAYAIYIERIGRRPAPMDDDYAEKLRERDVFVAVEDGAGVGLIVLLIAEDHLLIENIAIDPGHQGRGIGRSLMALAETYAGDRRIPELRLYTNAAMTENLAIYPRLGYRETGRRTINGFERVFFSKRLDPASQSMGDGPDSPSQSIWIRAPGVDPLIDGFRRDGDWSRGLGIPAHVTLAGPLPLSLALPRERLAELATAARGTRYRLDVVGRLGTAICLLPEDPMPLLHWRERLLGEIGAADTAWRPHLTISRDASPDAFDSIREAVDPALPINCEIGDLCVSRLVGPDRVLVETF